MVLTPKKRTGIVLALIALALLVDQILKIVVKTNMSLGESIPVFGNWFQILFVENNGMAFGMELVGKTFLSVFRIIAIFLLGWYLRFLLKENRYPFGYVVSIAFILAGASGNLIDCLIYGEIFSSSLGGVAELVPLGEGYSSFLHGRVVDMFYFPLFTWPEWMPLVGGDVFFGPVFNFADACISCSVAVLLIWYRKYLFK